MKNEIISYTAECNNRGYEKNNDQLINEINAKIKRFNNSIDSIKNQSKSEDDDWICDECGKHFTSNGYCEGDDGQWRPCLDADNTMPYICSYSCAMKKMHDIDNKWQKVEDEINDSRSSTNSDYYSRKREQMRRQGYTEGEINQMRDPNEGDPELME